MPGIAKKIQLNRDNGPKLAQGFDDGSAKSEAVHKNLLEQVNQLKGGDWKGPNAEKFYQIMEQTLFPANKRLTKALDEAGDTMRQVTKMINDADEEIKTLFPS
jgi:WXG100 family type VII secretion target